jgi:hypothetical protein
MNQEQSRKREQILEFAKALRVRKQNDNSRSPTSSVAVLSNLETDALFNLSEFESNFCRSSGGVELRAEDIMLVNESEWIEVLEDYRFVCATLIAQERCWCGVPACVSLPLAALAKMLIGGYRSGEAFHLLRDVNWGCFPRMKADVFRAKDFSEWVLDLSDQSQLPRCQNRREHEIDIHRRAGARILEIIGRMDLFAAFKSNEGGWSSKPDWLVEHHNYLEEEMYLSTWQLAESGDIAAIRRILGYEGQFPEDGGCYGRIPPREELVRYGARLRGLWHQFINAYDQSHPVVSIEDGEQVLLIALGFFGSWSEELPFYYEESDYAPEWYIATPSYGFNSLCIAVEGLCWWRASIVSSRSDLISLLDVLNRVQQIKECAVSGTGFVLDHERMFKADFIRYHRCILSAVSSGGEKCNLMLSEMTEIAKKRCHAYRSIDANSDKYSSYIADDPAGTYFIQGIVRAYLGEFGFKSDVESAKRTLFSTYVADCPPVDGHNKALRYSSYNKDPGFSRISLYYKKRGNKSDAYAWGNVSRIFCFDASLAASLSRRIEEGLSLAEIVDSQKKSRGILELFEGRFPPQYDANIVEYLGSERKLPGVLESNGFDGNSPEESLLRSFIEGLVYMGLEDYGRLGFLGDRFYFDNFWLVRYEKGDPVFPLDYEKAMQCFMRAFSIEPENDPKVFVLSYTQAMKELLNRLLHYEFLTAVPISCRHGLYDLLVKLCRF